MNPKTGHSFLEQSPVKSKADSQEIVPKNKELEGIRPRHNSHLLAKGTALHECLAAQITNCYCLKVSQSGWHCANSPDHKEPRKVPSYKWRICLNPQCWYRLQGMDYMDDIKLNAKSEHDKDLVINFTRIYNRGHQRGCNRLQTFPLVKHNIMEFISALVVLIITALFLTNRERWMLIAQDEKKCFSTSVSM